MKVKTRMYHALNGVYKWKSPSRFFSQTRKVLLPKT